METEDENITCSDLSHVKMTTENVTMTFKDWTEQSAQYFYPNIGTDTYRVPAYYYNHQTLLTPEQAVRKKLIPLPKISQQALPSTSSLSSSSSSSSSGSSSGSTSPYPVLSVANGEDVGNEDVAMTESDSSVSDFTSGESLQRNVKVHPREHSNVSISDRKKSDSMLENQHWKNADIRREEHICVNNSLSSLDAMSHTWGSSPSTLDHASHPNSESAISKTQAIRILGCTKNMHGPEKNCSHFVTIEAAEQSVVSNGHSDHQQTKVPSTKRRPKRRRNGHAKHLKKVAEKRADGELRELPADTPQHHEHEDLSVGIFNELVLLDSNDDEDEEDEPSEKKERSSDPATLTPSNEKRSDSSTQPAHHLGGTPLLSGSSSSSSSSSSSRKKQPTTQKLRRRYPKSSLRPPHTRPVLVKFPPQESMLRRDKAMSLVLDSFQAVGETLEAGGEDGLFLLSGINYDHYLCRVPASVLRSRVGGYLGDSPTCRGIVDLMILQRHAGMVLVQVKSVGGNLVDWQADEEDMVQAVRTVVGKVRARSAGLRRDTWRELIGPAAAHARGAADAGDLQDAADAGDLQDAADAEDVRHVLVLPFIPRAVYEKTLQDSGQLCRSSNSNSNSSSLEPAMQVLCKEDFEDSPPAVHHLLLDTGEPRNASTSLVASKPDRRSVGPAAAGSCLLRWWRTTFDRSRPAKLSLDKIKDIVGRCCGPFSTRAAQPDSKCRSEVRTLGHSISETANRYSAPCLTLSQFALLTCRDPHVTLCAPTGSGKSLLLSLKAVQWLEQGAGEGQDHVVVASFSRRHSNKMATPPPPPPPPRDQLLQSAIYGRKLDTLSHRKTGELLHATLHVASQIDSDDAELEVAHTVESLLRCVRQARSSGGGRKLNNAADACEMQDSVTSSLLSDKFHFILNDVDSPSDEKTQRVLGALRRHPLVQSVWWSTTEPPRTQEMTSHFRVETLEHVTRRPPSVQRVMKAVEWREPWQGLYAVDSVESALPSEGPPVVFIQHQLHRQDTWEHCAALHTCPNRLDAAQKNENPRQSPVQNDMTDGDTWNTSWNRLEQADQEHEMDQEQSSDYDQTCYANNTREPIDPNHQHQDKDHTPERDDVGLWGHYTFKQDESETFLLANKGTECLDSNAGSSRSVCKKGEIYSGSRSHSPFWCERCADTVADMISQLVIDSINPNVAPFLVGSTKLLKEPSKNRFGEAIKPRDILILADFTPQNSTMPQSDYQQKNRFDSLVHSTLVLRIQEVVPLEIPTEECSSKIAFPNNSAVLTDLARARGLERKVVIYVPGDTDDAQPCVASRQNVGTATNLVQSLQCKRMNETRDTADLSKNYHAVNGHSEFQDGVSSMEHSSLASLSSGATSSCLEYEEAMRVSTQRQRFVLCEHDTNRNTLVLEENQDESVPRSAFSEDPHEYGDIEMWSRNSVETRSERKHDAMNDVRDTEEDRDSHFSKTASYYNENRCNGNTNSSNFSPQTLFTSTLQYQEHPPQKQQEAGLSVSSTPSREQLPRWIKDKQRLIHKRNVRHNIRQNVRSRVQCRDVRRAPSSVGKEADGTTQGCMSSDLHSLLAGLSDISRRGVFAAAACCLAQLVIVLP